MGCYWDNIPSDNLTKVAEKQGLISKIQRAGNMSETKKRFNCCERVLMNIQYKLGFDNIDQFLKIASGFGGGVSGRSSICGAVSGAIIALSLKFGTDGKEDYDTFNEKRNILRKIAQDFLIAFENEHGAVDCCDLLGYSQWTEEGQKRHQENRDTRKYQCDKYINFSSKYVSDFLDKS